MLPPNNPGSEPRRVEEWPKLDPRDWLFENIRDASRHAEKVHATLVISLLLTLTVILSNSYEAFQSAEHVQLPILHAEIPAAVFLVMAPLINFVLYTYLKLYGARIRGLIEQTYESPGGIPRRRLYPWMGNIAEDPEDGWNGKLQLLMVEFWGITLLVPIMALNFRLAWRADSLFVQIWGLSWYIATMAVFALVAINGSCPGTKQCFRKAYIAWRIVGPVLFAFGLFLASIPDKWIR